MIPGQIDFQKIAPYSLHLVSHNLSQKSVDLIDKLDSTRNVLYSSRYTNFKVNSFVSKPINSISRALICATLTRAIPTNKLIIVYERNFSCVYFLCYIILEICFTTLHVCLQTVFTICISFKDIKWTKYIEQ